jgi:aldose sugar dehydrogenase
MRRRRGWIVSLSVAALSMAILTVMGATSAASARVRAARVAGGLNQSVAFTVGPNDRIWYVEKDTGEIRILNRRTGRHRRFALVSRVDGTGERGLLGIALHPAYPESPYVYVYATRRAGGRLRNQILRIRDRRGRGVDPRAIFSSPASSRPYHNGGRILFGPDGMLYAVVGEGHHPRRAQQLRTDQGKILRMTPGGEIPPDNPLGRRRVFAYGIRNSFGFGFDPRTGDLWETENGPECNDELNHVRAGRNYGWGPSETCSGQAPRNTNRDGPNPVLPRRWYTPPIAPTGLAFCRGCRLGRASEGALFFGALNTGQIRRFQLNAARDDVRRERIVYRHGSGILSIEAAPNGTLYFSDFNAIYRLKRG